MTRVKICGLTRAADVADAVRLGADALGFVFTDRSKRFVDADCAGGLVRAVPAFVSRVGLFMDQQADAVAAVLDKVPLTLLQFHGIEEAAFCRQFGLPYIKALSGPSLQSVSEVEREYFDAAALLLDSHSPGAAGGTGRVFDWASIPRFGMPLVLAGGLTAENVGEAVQQVAPWAVDVSSGVEDAPGQKNAAKMQNFINEAKREN